MANRIIPKPRTQQFDIVNHVRQDQISMGLVASISSGMKGQVITDYPLSCYQHLLISVLTQHVSANQVIIQLVNFYPVVR